MKYLFRGKTEEGKWVEGDLIQANLTYIATNEQKDDMIVSLCRNMGMKLTDVVPESVGQYTGLKDKSGKRIFEGDTFLYDGMILFLVLGAGCFMLYEGQPYRDYEQYSTEFSDLYDSMCGHIEICGNIINNPELLEE